MLSKNLFFIIILVIITINSAIFSTSKSKYIRTPLENTDSTQFSQNTRPISIHVDYTNIERENSEDSIIFITKLVFPMVIERIQTFLSISGPHEVGPLRNENCKQDEIKQINPAYFTESTQADLILFVGMTRLFSHIYAYSNVCGYHSSNFRPIAGQIIVNSLHSSPDSAHLETLFSTILHEVVHVLGLNQAVFQFYTRVDGQSAFFTKNKSSYFRGSETVKKAREHFQCETISSIRMENQGNVSSQGSHLERVNFGNEIMVAENVQKSVLSVFTLSILKDSGFYSVDFGKAEMLHWGRARGCGFLETLTCEGLKQFEEICSEEDQLNCAAGAKYISKCNKSDYSDDCFLNEPRFMF